MAAKEEKQYFPSCWNDDAKMTAHFSPLRTTTANPEGTSSKINFWKTCIDSFCRTSKRSCFTDEDIIKAFTRNGRTPQCIPTVLEEMAKSSDIYEMSSFLNLKPINKPGVTWTSWALDLGKKPIFWTLNKVKNVVLSPAQSEQQKYVHKQTIQDIANDILKNSPELRGKVVQFEELLEKCNLPLSHTDDGLLAVYWLYCQDQAALLNFDMSTTSKVLVKLAPSNQSKVSISETDLCKYNLLKLSKRTEAKIAEYEEKCNQAREEARALIMRKSKALALSQLKKKKMYEETINKEANILNNIHGLLETLNQTESNQEVIGALKTANAAIKNVQKEANLTEDTVLDVMDDLRDTIETQENINAAISQTVVPDDSADLEKELDNLLQDIATEDDLCKWVENLKLPDLPGSPNASMEAPTPAKPKECLAE